MFSFFISFLFIYLFIFFLIVKHLQFRYRPPPRHPPINQNPIPEERDRGRGLCSVPCNEKDWRGDFPCKSTSRNRIEGNLPPPLALRMHKYNFKLQKKIKKEKKNWERNWNDVVSSTGKSMVSKSSNEMAAHERERKRRFVES